jgi:hypothetical protein
MAFTKCYFRFGDRLATSDSCHQIRYVSHERSREPRFLDERRRRLLIDLSFDGRETTVRLVTQTCAPRVL